MRIAIMQPYFLPYIGYMALIKQVDEFILLDEVQFIRHGWIERNRIIKPSGGWQYIAVPLKKHGQKTLISQVEINNEIKWKEKILAQLVHYKKAPYYEEAIEVMEEILESPYEDVTQLNKKALECVCKYLDVNTPIKIFSEMNLEIEKTNAPDEWALNICKKMPHVREYWNPIGGLEFFDKKKYEKAEINIKFLKMNLQSYKQGKYVYEEGLSIIDVMMYNSVEEINRMMDDYVLY